MLPLGTIRDCRGGPPGKSSSVITGMYFHINIMSEFVSKCTFSLDDGRTLRGAISAWGNTCKLVILSLRSLDHAIFLLLTVLIVDLISGMTEANAFSYLGAGGDSCGAWTRHRRAFHPGQPVSKDSISANCRGGR